MPDSVSVTQTRRVTLDIPDRAIDTLQQALPVIYNKRLYSTGETKFTIILSQKSEEDTLEDVKKQQGKVQYPLFVIRRLSMERTTDGSNYVARRDGIRIGAGKGRTEAATVHPIPVNMQLEVSLYAQEFSVVKHMSEAMLFYAEESTNLGQIELTDPSFTFPVNITASASLDFPEHVSYNDVKLFKLIMPITLKTYIADLEYTPTIASVTVDGFLADQQDRHSKYQVIPVGGEEQKVDFDKPLYKPDTNFTVNIRTKISDPFKRD